MLYQSHVSTHHPLASVSPLPVVSLLGLDSLGTLAAARLANEGYQVICVDPSPESIERFTQGCDQMAAPALRKKINEGLASGRITTTDDILAAIMKSDITVLSVEQVVNLSDQADRYALNVMGRTIGASIAEKSRFHRIIYFGAAFQEHVQEAFVRAVERASGLQTGLDYDIAHIEPTTKNCKIHRQTNMFDEVILGTCEDPTVTQVRSLFSRMGITSIDKAFVHPAYIRILEQAEFSKVCTTLNWICESGDKYISDNSKRLRAS